MKKIDVSKKAFVAWVKSPKAKAKEFRIKGFSDIRTKGGSCPLVAWGKDLGVKRGQYATILGRDGNRKVELAALKLEHQVINAADSSTLDLKKDSQERRLRNLMLKSFGIKEP